MQALEEGRCGLKTARSPAGDQSPEALGVEAREQFTVSTGAGAVAQKLVCALMRDTRLPRALDFNLNVTPSRVLIFSERHTDSIKTQETTSVAVMASVLPHLFHHHHVYPADDAPSTASLIANTLLSPAMSTSVRGSSKKSQNTTS